MTKITALRMVQVGVFSQLVSDRESIFIQRLIAENLAYETGGKYCITEKGLIELQQLENIQNRIERDIYTGE